MMKSTTTTLAWMTCLLGAVAAVGCASASTPSKGSGGSQSSSSGGNGSGSGGNGSGSGGSNGSGGSSGSSVSLMPDSTGWVDEMSNSLGVQGAWYGYGDAYGRLDCSDPKLNGSKCIDPNAGNHMPSECSKIEKPTVPAEDGVGFPNENGKMCTKGTIAKVINIVGTTNPDYSNVWGAGIGLDLAAAKGADACAPKTTFDAKAKNVTGVQFTIDKVPPPGLRVEFPMPNTDATKNGSDYWGGNGSFSNSPVMEGTNTIDFSGCPDDKAHCKVTPPGTADMIPFDPSKIESIQFHVPAGTGALWPSDYEFCISDLKLLTK